MQPTSGYVFVKKADKQKSKYEVVDSTEARYEVTHTCDVDICRTGDFVLFKDVRTYRFDGEDIHVVHESDIVAVKAGK